MPKNKNIDEQRSKWESNKYPFDRKVYQVKEFNYPGFSFSKKKHLDKDEKVKVYIPFINPKGYLEDQEDYFPEGSYYDTKRYLIGLIPITGCDDKQKTNIDPCFESIEECKLWMEQNCPEFTYIPNHYPEYM
jgi:hypothetical protein